ncbi:MAG: ThiF family adenylyltransferase, partial [Gallionella sp.]
VGRLTLCDHDTVDMSNLQRQIAHHSNAVGTNKVDSACATLRSINPEIDCVPLAIRADAARLHELIAAHDVVLDCSDNFDTRYAINRACHALHKPLVSGAAIQFSGQASVFDFRKTDAPCYNCLYPEDSLAQELRCATTGVFAPLVGIIGTLQAAEALKLLLGIDTGLSGRLLTVAALDMRIRDMKLSRDPSCSVCGKP